MLKSVEKGALAVVADLSLLQNLGRDNTVCDIFVWKSAKSPSMYCMNQ